MSTVIALPVVVPLAGAALALALRGHVKIQRALGVLALVVSFAASVAVLVDVRDGGAVVVDVGSWPAPVGISLVADMLAALMLVVSTAMALAVLVYAIGSPRTADDSPFFYPAYMILTAGVGLSFLAGDLFNLFVAFEVMLSASYVLITLGGTREQVRSGMTYIVISLLASTLFVTALGLIYSATGTVNMADLAVKMAEVPDGVRTALGLLLLVVFGVKAAIFPLFFWLPDSYPTAPTPVTAIFAGLLTKVGVYAIIRTQTLIFPPLDGQASAVLLAIAAATMIVGVLGAIAQDDVKRILSFHIISQIGYMIMGLALFSVAGIGAAIFYMIHHIIVKTTLFLVGGIIEEVSGTGALRRLGGLVHSAPVIAVLFAIPALSLAGLPPFSGFVSKLALVDAGLSIDQGTIVAVSLVVSLLTLFSMTKIWAGVFWGEPDEAPVRPLAGADGKVRTRPMMTLPTAALVIASIGVALWAGPLLDMSNEAATNLLDNSNYLEAVLGR